MNNQSKKMAKLSDFVLVLPESSFGKFLHAGSLPEGLLMYVNFHGSVQPFGSAGSYLEVCMHCTSALFYAAPCLSGFIFSSKRNSDRLRLFSTSAFICLLKIHSATFTYLQTAEYLYTQLVFSFSAERGWLIIIIACIWCYL